MRHSCEFYRIESRMPDPNLLATAIKQKPAVHAIWMRPQARFGEASSAFLLCAALCTSLSCCSGSSIAEALAKINCKPAKGQRSPTEKHLEKGSAIKDNLPPLAG